jgi:hypothetical protein
MSCFAASARGPTGWLARDVIGTFHAVKWFIGTTSDPPLERQFNRIKNFTPLSDLPDWFILQVGRNGPAGYITA